MNEKVIGCTVSDLMGLKDNRNLTHMSNKNIGKIKVHWITYRLRGEKMIKEREVRLEGCICELCSDISPNWKEIRTGFGDITLGEIDLQE